MKIFSKLKNKIINKKITVGIIGLGYVGLPLLMAFSIKNFKVIGFDTDKKKIKEHLDNSLMLVTALAPHIGYDQASKIAKNALKNNTSLKYEALKTGLINEKNYEKIVDPKKMIYPK